MALPDHPTLEWLQQEVQESVRELYRRDEKVLGTTERVVVGRLIIYLYERLRKLERDGWVLDQEYQRIEEKIKRTDPGDPRSPKIVPDLALHRRMDSTGNLLVIEVKTSRESKDPSNSERLHDFAKLSLLTETSKYVDAYRGNPVLLRLPGSDPPPGRGAPQHISLDGMAPYEHGLWLRVPQRYEDAGYWWWSEGKFLGEGPAT